MKEIRSKKDYLKQLKRKLLFKYSREDVNSIVMDYNEIFEVEESLGKTEMEICLLLGSPEIIVENLNEEKYSENNFNKNILIKESLLNFIYIAIICFIGVYIIYRTNYNRSSKQMLELMIAFPAILLLLRLLLQLIEKMSKSNSSKLIANKGLLQTKFAHLICFLIYMFTFIFLNSIIINIKSAQIGKLAVGFLYTFIIILLGLILTSIFKIKSKQWAFFNVISHALGVITIILYYIIILKSLSDFNVYHKNIRASGFIYLETLIMIFIFWVFNNKKEIQE